MATALLSSPPLLPPSSNLSILSKKQSKILWKQKKCGKFMASSHLCKEPTSYCGVSRRDLTFIALSSSLSLIFPFSADSKPMPGVWMFGHPSQKRFSEETLAWLYAGRSAEEELKMASSVDDINAYSYLYPIEMPSKKFVFKWVETRKPERYSSAAPLSPDARLRIVSERVDIIDNLIISVSIGPPNSQFLKSKEKSTWRAKDVADSVLSDKSALVIDSMFHLKELTRVTSTQRLAESSLLDAHASEAQEPNLFRHYVASTAERDGYLYTFSASTLGKQWEKILQSLLVFLNVGHPRYIIHALVSSPRHMGLALEKTVASFRLLPPTENYVPPYKDPWRMQRQFGWEDLFDEEFESLLCFFSLCFGQATSATKMPPKRTNERRNGNQQAPPPTPANPLNEQASYAEFRAAFIALA
ncbi:PsbP domain-containing protein 5, chloroplastic [Capsicum annuum]|nr:PsbP domain-containing protein 5, chloroplastic [Capsicum annuum]